MASKKYPLFDRRAVQTSAFLTWSMSIHLPFLFKLFLWLRGQCSGNRWMACLKYESLCQHFLFVSTAMPKPTWDVGKERDSYDASPQIPVAEQGS
jgi:hypothetical protein